MKNLRQSKQLRLTTLLCVDAGGIFLAYGLAFWLRFDTFFRSLGFWADYRLLFWKSLPFLVGLRVMSNWFWRLYYWSFSYAGNEEAGRLIFSALSGSAAFILLNFFLNNFGLNLPRSIYVLEFFLSLMLMALPRFIPRYLYDLFCSLYLARQKDGRTILIYGAGGYAELMIRELIRTTGHPYRLAGLVDDSPAKRHVRIAGLKVLGGLEDLPQLIPAFGVIEIFIAIPGFSSTALRRLVELCEPFGISYKIVPSYQSVLSGHRNILAVLEEIKPDALINRSAIAFDQKRLHDFYQGRAVLITGAAGSIGSETALQLAVQGVRHLTILDQDENGIFFLFHDLRRLHPELETSFEIGSVRDEAFLKDVLARRRPYMVIHAAAHKHVPLMEQNPVAAVKNNVLGTMLTAEAALDAGVKHFLLISTDKAVAPANVMGASKRLAEMVVQSFDGSALRPTIVRFGNVLGSNGSLLPIIQRQIRRGGPVTVTDPKMSRFFMTIPEAIGLVLVTPSLAHRDIFVLDMGEPINIDRLVRHVIALSGLVPGCDIDIVYTQKRAGEKLNEELFLAGDDLSPTEHQGIMGLNQKPADLDLAALKAEILSLDATSDSQAARRFLKARVPEYSWVT
jgi:FlaA1/EpsC-like NDP-sugar epimerase